MIKNHKKNLINLLNSFGIISIGIVLVLFSSFHFKAYSQNNKIGKRVKPLIVIKDANRPSLSYDGKRIVELPEIGLSEVFDVDTGKKLRTFVVKDSESQAISADGKIVRIFGGELHATFDIDSGEKLSDGSIEFKRDGKPFGFGKVWNEGGFNSKNITSDLRLIAHEFFPKNYANPNPESPAVILGNLDNNFLIQEFKTDDGFLGGDEWGRISITPDGKFVAAYRHNAKDKQRNTTIVWNAETGKVIFDLPSYDLESLSDDGKRIAAEKSNDEGQLEIWDVPSEKRISTLTEKVNGKKIIISRVIFSPDGKILVTTGNEEFYFWDTETGKQIASEDQSKYSEGNVKSLSFSGNGKRIAVGSDTEVVTVWSVDEILNNVKQTNYAVAGIR